jgi:hypothetical protein
MKSHSKTVLLVLLALVAVCFTNAPKSYAVQDAQKPAAEQASDQEGIEIEDEAELKDWEDAQKEPDYDKRATKLLAFIEKYPKTQLKPHFEYAYNQLFTLCKKEKKWEALQSIIEKWLKAYPDSPNRVSLTAMNAEASEELGNFIKCAECLEEIYAKEPKNELIYSIFKSYEKANNLSKQLLWADKLLQTPEYAGYYWIPYKYFRTYTDSKNAKEAAAWMAKTQKSLDAAKDLTPEQKEEVKTVQLVINTKNAQDAFDAGKYKQSIDEWKKTLKAKKTCVAYLNIGMAQWKLKGDPDDIMSWLARAELMNEGECSAEAKKQVENLYRSQHGGNLTGIEKNVYKPIRDEMGK